MNTSDVYECISFTRENGYTEFASAAVSQLDEVFVTIERLEADNAKLRSALIDAVHEIKSQFVLRFDCNFDEAGEDNPTVKAARALLGGEE